MGTSKDLGDSRGHDHSHHKTPQQQSPSASNLPYTLVAAPSISSMDGAEEAFRAFRAHLIASTTQQHNAAKEALKRKCAAEMAQMVSEHKIEIDELHDLDPQALVAKCLPTTTNAAATAPPKKQERATNEVFDSDEEDEDEKQRAATADFEPFTAAMVTSKKRSRASDASSAPEIKRRSHSVISINTDTSHHPLASPPASVASMASTRPQRARKPAPPRGEVNYKSPEKLTPAPKPSPPPEQAEESTPTSLDMPFCEHILDLIRQARAAQLFMHPVDGKKYPTYYNIISRPMDLSTMTRKLEDGEYKDAEEFKADFDLMIRNCLKFNPCGEVARDMGIMLDRHFSNEWNWRPEWEKEIRRKSGGGGKK